LSEGKLGPTSFAILIVAQSNRRERSRVLVKDELAQLTTLDLSSNQIGEKGAEFLSKASWPNLTTLHLFDNKSERKEQSSC